MRCRPLMVVARFSPVGLVLAAVLGLAGCSAEARKARVVDRAARYFSEGKLEAARIEYLNVLQLEPNSAIATERLGLIWLERGAPATALPLLMKARDLSPNDSNIRAKLAGAYLALGKTELAKAEALAIFERSPGNGEALMLLAQAMRTTGDLKQAQQFLRNVAREDAASNMAAAAIAIRRGDIAAAKNSANRALNLDPKSAEAHSIMAGIHMLQHDAVGAANERKLAAELAPIRSAMRLRYADDKAQSGAVNDAIALLQDITRQAPDYFPAWTSLAQIALSQQKHDEALALLQNVLKQSPINYEANVLRGQVLLAKGETRKAIEVLQELGKAYSGFAPDKYQLACAHLRNKDAAQAIIALKQAIAANSDHDDAVMLLADVYLMTGDPKSVVNLMVELLTRRPDLSKAQTLLIDALRVLRRSDDAIAVIRQQIQNHPDEAQPHFLLGLVLREQDKPAEARASFERSLELAANQVPIVAQLVDLDLRENKFSSAAQRTRDILKKFTDSPAAHFLAARVLAAQEKWDDALTALFTTIDLDGSHAPAYDLLSFAIARNKIEGPTMDRLQAWLASKSENLPAVLLLGSIHGGRGEFTTARDIYEKHLGAKPDSGPVLNNLACLYSEQLNDLDRAKRLASKARDIEPDSPLIADTLGWILFKRQEYPQALALLKESAAKLADNPEIQFHLGVVCQATGDSQMALAAFRKASQANAAFAGRAELKQRLSQLEAAAIADAAKPGGKGK